MTLREKLEEAILIAGNDLFPDYPSARNFFGAVICDHRRRVDITVATEECQNITPAVILRYKVPASLGGYVQDDNLSDVAKGIVENAREHFPMVSEVQA